MASGLRYRVLSVFGVAAGTVIAVTVANNPVTLRVVSLIPVVGQLPAISLSNGALFLAIVTTLPVMIGSLVPLFKPRPRRLLDTIFLTEKRVFMAAIALAAIGYFDYTYRLPRLTLVVTAVLLWLGLPIWFLLIRHRPSTGTQRAVIIGDDPDAMAAIFETAALPIIGYVAPPPSRLETASGDSLTSEITNGGMMVGRSSLDDIEYLGGRSRLDEILVEYDIDTAVLAFSRTDRAEFFGALDTCYEHGVTAKVHREHADSVLTRGISEGDLVELDLEPWDWQDYVIKRGFDIAFAGFGLLVLAPAVILITAAIKWDTSGPVLYSQERTAEFGETFTVYKFRTMVPDAEAESGAKLSQEDFGGVDPRVTRVGRILRQTHLDEIPQLWSILVGEMSVVGPRPERPELDEDIESGIVEWRRRWFVKPGLTGLAQINHVTGHEPEKKLRYDIEYIRNQSFWFDVKIIARQLWLVFQDVTTFVT